MKKLLLTMLLPALALAAKPCKAQKNNWSTGIRIGARYDDLFMQPSSSGSIVNPEAGLFIKRRIYKRLFAELGAGYLSASEHYPLIYWDTSGNTLTDGTVNASIKTILVNIGLTYNLIQAKKMEIYLSGGITNRHFIYKSKATSSQFGWFTNNDPMKTRLLSTMYLGAGLNYNVTSHLYLNMNTRLETLTNASSFELRIHGGPTFIPTAHVGVGYRF